MGGVLASQTGRLALTPLLVGRASPAILHIGTGRTTVAARRGYGGIREQGEDVRDCQEQLIQASGREALSFGSGGTDSQSLTTYAAIMREEISCIPDS